ncbi:MAG: hypothetical protein HFI01_07620 [Lachnospiraceae bacterium]|nr:hypothetical protein [Lachnospiraceae bacterium]
MAAQGPASLGAAAWLHRDGFCDYCKKSRNFTYEMANTQGENAMDGVFKKPGQGCPCF